MREGFSWIDWGLVGAYFLVLIRIGWKKGWKQEPEIDYLLSGRKITLPAFVATLVATWYGGILGVGEWSYQFGISQWLVLGAPFYFFSALFAIFLAGRIRDNVAFTIPEAIANRHGAKAGQLAALPVFILVSPAPYILMLGMLFQYLAGGDAPFLLYASLVALFSVLYIAVGGFRAVIRTDTFQVALMFVGFFALLGFAWANLGSPATLWRAAPEGHRDITGGRGIQYLLVWFFIALWTFVDPSFHQRSAAAATPAIARKGVFLSIGFWMGFDVLTAFAGLYAFAILGPDLEQPTLAYPILADAILPVGVKGAFFVALLATIMSTLDSYLFLSGQTLGRDFLGRRFPSSDPNRLTRMSILASAALGIALIALFPSVIDLWYVIGSVFIPGLLAPVLGLYLPVFSLKTRYVFASVIGCAAFSIVWLSLGVLDPSQPAGYAYLGVEPFYPGLLLAVALWAGGRRKA